MNNTKNSKNKHINLNWKNLGNRNYMNNTLIKNQVNIYKSLYLNEFCIEPLFPL